MSKKIMYQIFLSNQVGALSTYSWELIQRIYGKQSYIENTMRDVMDIMIIESATSKG